MDQELAELHRESPDIFPPPGTIGTVVSGPMDNKLHLIEWPEDSGVRYPYKSWYYPEDLEEVEV